MTSPASESPQIPGDLLERIQQTVDDMRAQGADFQPDLEGGAPVSPKRRRLWVGALAFLMIAELALIAVAARLEGEQVAAVAVPSPCERGIAAVEAALEAFRAEQGHLPGTLELLVPQHLPAVPRPDGSAIEYQGQGSGYVLRCAGPS